jgi:hypothetical protein
MTSFRDYHVNTVVDFVENSRTMRNIYNPLRKYTLNSAVSHCGNQSAREITEFCSVNVDPRYYRISVACDIME